MTILAALVWFLIAVAVGLAGILNGWTERPAFHERRWRRYYAPENTNGQTIYGNSV